ncbi:MAG: TonB-dependent receptor [Calditrichaeota bacterium]|nr:TonB-dependent receptor [Calditrichota bacterium]
MKKLLILALVLMLPLALFAQRGTITGKVTDANTGDALVGANVVIKGTTIGSAAGIDGAYKITKVPAGTYTLRASFIGYKMAEKQVQVTSGQVVEVNFQLGEDVIFGQAISIVADRAKERETPVAFTDIRKVDMVQRLGSQDIPMILNTTPSVYATMQGGGAGDARINVRGFNQRNVAIMINGVPVNDMENGWVYWSNWDGIADATSSIQIQRGLSAVNLATPSIGGTMNIITDPTSMEKGITFRQEVGTAGFLKTTLTANSGLVADKFAFNGLVVRKTGDGFIDKTWTDAWAYYFGASWNVNANNRLELYALGAPQRHGQNLYKQNIAVYSHDFAKNLSDYDQAAFDKFQEKGREFNQNWAPVSSSYKGKQAWNEKTGDRYNPNFINERENFFHKPQVNLNWFSKFNDQMSLYTVLYYSGGHGGGTGTYGNVYTKDANGKLGDDDYKFYYGPSPWVRDWDATIAMNSGPAGDYYVDKKKLTKEDGQSLGILRNSRNNQWTIGAISKLNYKFSDNLKSTFGVDWRTAEIEHYREVRDLLGGEFYIKKNDAFHPDQKVGLGEKIAYNFTNTVDWFGFFGQAEYSSARVTAYGMAGYSTIKYTHTNHFKKEEGTNNELYLKSDQIGGYQVKGGASYRVTSALDVYGNLGYVSKVPIFDQVIDDYTSTVATDPKNEKFISGELGVNWAGLDNTLTAKMNLYYTTWKDRSVTRGVRDLDGNEAILFISGLNALHQGIEFESAYQPMEMFRLDLAASIGNWKYLDDVDVLYKDYSNPDNPDKRYQLYIKDLKVGDAPQTQFALAGSVYPMPGLTGQLVFRYYQNHFADFDPTNRTDKNDRTQSWEVPSAYVMDFHAAYDLPFSFSGIKFQLFAHVFNILDQEYIQDAVDNSRYNAWSGDDDKHDSDSAEVFFGLPRTFNIGLALRY